MRKRDERGHAIEALYGAPGGPLYAVHANGYPYAAFASENHAWAYWRGLDARGREYMHIENAAGERVRIVAGSHGHAQAIIDREARR